MLSISAYNSFEELEDPDDDQAFEPDELLSESSTDENGPIEGGAGAVVVVDVGEAVLDPVLALVPAPPESKWPRFKVPGGWIIITDKEMNAACDNADHVNPKNPCRLNRTIKPARPDTTILGRPAAFLMAWLAHRTCKSEPLHKSSAVKSKRTAADRAALSLEVRERMRDWLEASGPPEILLAERELRAGEPREQGAL
jgi:hypothetical protein